ncbi:MAG TPA: DUF4418 domain-containing protein [Clostridiales bacterium]|nr:DUF4418 domain-containing protein [Clostridiales bacterium]
MKSKGTAGAVLLITLGLLIILIPNILLPVCTGRLALLNGGAVPMKCHYTAVAEIIPGIVVMVCGFLRLLFARGKAGVAVYIVAAVCGMLVILLATVIIGVCPGQGMACRVGSQPGLLLAGAFTIIVGGGSALLQIRNTRRE